MHFMSFSGCIIFKYVVQDAILSCCCVPCILSHFIALKSQHRTTGSSNSRYSLVAPQHPATYLAASRNPWSMSALERCFGVTRTIYWILLVNTQSHLCLDVCPDVCDGGPGRETQTVYCQAAAYEAQLKVWVWSAASSENPRRDKPQSPLREPIMFCIIHS